MSALSAGSTNLSEEKTLKLLTSCSSASFTATAVPGAVVSKPTPRKTTCFPGSFLAISTASTGEYTILTSAPAAARLLRLSPLLLPGTLSMSP